MLGRSIPRRAVRRLLVVAALGVSLSPACRDPGPAVRKLEMPDAGVAVRWKLEPGHALVGHLRVGSTRQIEGMARPLDQSIECDVTLAVLAPSSSQSGLRMRASFSDIELEWGLPPSAEYGTAEFLALAAERVRKLQPWLELGPDGAIVAMSPLPADAPPELQDLLVVLFDALEASFLVLPSGSVRRGATWTDSRTREGAHGGAWTIETTGRVDGLYRLKERELDVVALDFETRRRAKAMGTASEGEGHARVLFATEGYAAEVDREVQAFSADSGMVYRKIRADWRRTREIVPELVGGGDDGGQDVQVIGDPCNPDYVGPKVCDEPEPEPRPEPDTEGASESGEASAEPDGGTTGTGG